MSQPQTPYIENVMSLFGLRKQKAKAEQRGGAARPHPAKVANAAANQPVGRSALRKKGRKAFDDKLANLIARRDARTGLVTGRVQLINIDAVRDRLGERWPKFEGRVHDIIKKELTERLGPRDMFTRANEKSYVIVFGDCPEAEAKLRVAMLSQQILEKIFGEDDGKDVRALGVRTITAQADGSVATEAIDSVDSLMRYLDRAEAQPPEADSDARKKARRDHQDLSIEFADPADDPRDESTSHQQDIVPERPPVFAGGWTEQLARLEEKFALAQSDGASAQPNIPNGSRFAERDRLIAEIGRLEKQIANGHAATAELVVGLSSGNLITQRDRLLGELARVEKRLLADPVSAPPVSRTAPDNGAIAKQASLAQELARLEKQIATDHPATAAAPRRARKKELIIERDRVADQLNRLEKEIAAQRRTGVLTRNGELAPGAVPDLRGSPGFDALEVLLNPEPATSIATAGVDIDDWSHSDIEWHLDVRYLPMWHAPTQKVGVYLCEATISLSVDGVPQPPDLGRDEAVDLAAVTDRLALRSAHKDLQLTVSSGTPNVVAVPVHFSTLQNNRERQRLVDACRYIPEPLRRVLIWEVRGTQVDNWGHQLPALLHEMKPFGRAIFLRLENVQQCASEIRRNLRDVKLSGVHAVGVDVSTLKGPEAKQLNLLEALAAAAEQHGLNCYGHGFDSLSMTICAVCMGYQHVSGTAIAEPIEQPQGIHTTEMEKVYGRALFDVA